MAVLYVILKMTKLVVSAYNILWRICMFLTPNNLGLEQVKVFTSFKKFIVLINTTL